MFFWDVFFLSVSFGWMGADGFFIGFFFPPPFFLVQVIMRIN